MSKVYTDPSSGYTYGPFPKATVPITRTINCPSPRIVVDTSSTDSTEVDSTSVEVPDGNEQKIQLPTPAKEPEVKKEEKTVPPPATPVAVVPLTRKEERELRRQQRQEEKEKTGNK